MMDNLSWPAVRRALGRRRGELTALAAAGYPGRPRAAATTLLTRPEWIPPAPLPLAAIRLAWDLRPPAPAVTGTAAGPELTAGRPTYAAALAALARPAVFENRPCYRLLAADLTGAAPALRCGAASYFDGLNVGEAVAHELALGVPGRPLRSRVGDPCDLRRRVAVPAISTLTVRRAPPGGSGGAGVSYVLHGRDPAKVAHAGGLFHVLPAGVFQPAGPGRGAADFDLWRCMVREFGEELLGTPEDYGPGFSYGEWPVHRDLAAARESGRLGVHCVGLGVDPLTLAVDILAVAVFDADAFDDLFGEMLNGNAEGRVRMAPFDAHHPEPMQPAGAAALALARRHRAALAF